MRFSKTTGGFYPEELKYAELPDDIVTISNDDHQRALTRAPDEEFEIVKGKVVIIKPKKATVKELTDASKLPQLASIKLAYTSASNENILYNDHLYSTDDFSCNKIAQYIALGVLPNGFAWLDENNYSVVLSIPELSELLNAVLTRNQELFTKYQNLKKQILNAKTVTAVQAVVW